MGKEGRLCGNLMGERVDDQEAFNGGVLMKGTSSDYPTI